MGDPNPVPTPVERYGRRALNFAESRLGLLHAAMELAVEDGLEEVSVDDIARRAGVSRMTFFNRFGEKDALLLHFAWTWWFGDTVQQVLDPVRGWAGIARLFRRVAEADRRHGRFFQGFAGYITRMAGSRPLMDAMRLTAAEKALLRPDVEGAGEIEEAPLQVQLRTYLREAADVGEIGRHADVPSLITDLASAMYGEVLMRVVTGATDLWPRYERQLDRIRWYAAQEPT